MAAFVGLVAAIALWQEAAGTSDTISMRRALSESHVNESVRHTPRLSCLSRTNHVAQQLLP